MECSSNNQMFVYFQYINSSIKQLRYLIFKLLNQLRIAQKKQYLLLLLSHSSHILQMNTSNDEYPWNQHQQDELPRNQFFTPSIPPEKDIRNKNCKLHIGNLPLQITEETLHRVFSKYGQIKEVKIIRKNSQGQPLKDYCYGFVLMCDGDGAQNAVTELKQNSPLGTTWTVAFSKDKNDDSAGAGHQKSDKKKDDKVKKKEKSKERLKKDKSKPKKKVVFFNQQKKKKSESSSSSDSSRARSAKKQKKQKKRKHSSSSESSSSKLPPRSALVKVENKDIAEIVFSGGDLQSHLMYQQQPQQQYQITHHVYVRELFISGIPQSKISADIQRIFSAYGIVERIDIVPKQLVNYAYVKFKRLESVLQAMQNSSLIAELLESAGQVKIYQSDPFRRVQIVGNAEDSEREEEMWPVMFIGFPPNQNYVLDEKFLKKMAEKFGGEVKGIQHFQPDSPQLRSYVLIEFSFLKDCKKARRKFCRYKIQILGDKKCDVAILSNYPTNVQNKRQNNMFMQQPYAMDYMQVNQQIPMHQQMVSRQIPQQVQMLAPFQNQPIPQQHIAPPNLQNIYDYNQMPILYPQQQSNQQQMMFMKNQQQQLQIPAQTPVQPQFRPQPQPVPQTQQPPPQLQYYQQLNPQAQAQSYLPQQYSMDMIIPPPTMKQEEINSPFWCGYMNRGKQHRVGIDARMHKTNMDTKKINLPSNLEMSYKCTYQDAYQRAGQDQSAILIFSPAQDTDFPKFAEYVQYLRNKQRAGVIQSEAFTIYVIPPGVSEAQLICNINQQEMIAIYCQKELK
ncbi:unnamed protein product (macronuclear) [Paramecium tetraurelia]|uniref:RRM domain-containing protein n=1 Tax=Paramecium tetraurelia TaxID=5888 RepID=A0DJK7_PARTE|nr:uncharacterized protein GSPATT00017568001 [Paramecium tetraurelia]CAK83224.1 unnamed protein product [Paramecium tetraurelia]|eukprot:XP_001450621.1 hypothetical protein (macronuclear) [Paramecium tetraurelia strain d4-2]